MLLILMILLGIEFLIALIAVICNVCNIYNGSLGIASILVSVSYNHARKIFQADVKC